MILITATWCNPCKDLKEWLNENNLMSHIEKVIEADKDPEAIAGLGVKSVPTLVDGNNILVGREQIKPYMEKLRVQ